MNNLSVQYNKNRYTKVQNTSIEQAFQFALAAHADQKRSSGDPYIVHPVAVAETVAEWGMDYEAVMAALLHDVVEDTPVTTIELAEEFSPKVAELVDGVTKLRLSSSPRPAAGSARLEASNENLRKLFLASAKDYRVILIKLADRLHNLRTLGHLDPERRQRIARESLEIYAPLADRLGMGALKCELEDIGFRYADPENYASLEQRVQDSVRDAQQYLAALKRATQKYLHQGGVEVIRIEGRQKHLYSVQKKLVKTGGDLEKIYDLVAVRIIVPDIAACYQTLGILHQHYKPLIYRIKDYIAVPKPNGYQSLHTTVFAEDGHITEIQIRTPEMHEAAERGLAAHFFYDAHKATSGYAKGRASVVPKSLGWVGQLGELSQEAGGEFAERARLELFADRIFVFSPQGDLYDLPDGSTPVDFAFAVHSDLGLRAQGARVNGRMVTLETRLENRDVVEIQTRREAAPNRDWLGFVVTAQAKNRIRSWFRAASREGNLASGRTLLDSALEVWGVKRLEELPKRAIAEALDGLHVKSTDDLFAQIGEGTLAVTAVIRRLIPDAARPAGARTVKRALPTGRIVIAGENLPYSSAACCNPLYPQPLMGYITRGKGVTVHALGCRNLPTDTERYVSCRWETSAEAQELVVCRVEVVGTNRVGLISDVTGVVASQGLNIGHIVSEANGETGRSAVSFVVEVPDLFRLSQVMTRLEEIRGVEGVRRVE